MTHYFVVPQGHVQREIVIRPFETERHHVTCYVLHRRVCREAGSIAASMPARSSAQVMRMSLTAQFLSSLSMKSQHFALSLSPMYVSTLRYAEDYICPHTFPLNVNGASECIYSSASMPPINSFKQKRDSFIALTLGKNISAINSLFSLYPPLG